MARREAPRIPLVDKVLLLGALLEQDMQAYFARTGLTAARVHLLWALREEPRTQRSLAQELRVSARNITGLVDGLVDSGHVVRRAHPTDRRAVHVTLTERGAGLVGDLVSGHRDLEKTMFAGVAGRDLAAFERTLDGVIDRLAAGVSGQSR